MRVSGIFAACLLATEILASASAAATIVPAWTISDLVQTRRFNSIATDDDGRVAYVLQEPQVTTGTLRYGLYQVQGIDAKPREIASATFIDNVTYSRPLHAWLVRGDFGEGTQLYAISATGQRTVVAMSPYPTILTGTWDQQIGGLGEPVKSGIYSYQVSPDGQCYWYSVLKPRTAGQLKAYRDTGIIYDDRTMKTFAPMMVNGVGEILAEELYTRCAGDKESTKRISIPHDQHMNLGTFNTSYVHWSSDSSTISYLTLGGPSGGQWTPRTMTVRSLAQLQTSGIPTPDPELVGSEGNKVLLLKWATRATAFGPVQFNRIKRELGIWVGPHRHRIAFIAEDGYHDVVVVLDAENHTVRTVGGSGTYHNCALSWPSLFCSWDALTDAPRLLRIDLESLAISTLTDPNEGFSKIPPLTFEWRTWRNKYGYDSNGFILYPRGYRHGVRYPTILVSHWRDARDAFADPSLEWEFPLTVLAERGFVVVAVNEPDRPSQLRTTFVDGRRVSPKDMQFSVVLNPEAAFEAAISSLVSDGTTDSRRVGIAGYSRGAEMVGYAMTQTDTFHAGVIGESGTGVQGYWNGGLETKMFLDDMYGGSPYSRDPNVEANYNRIAVPFRASQMSGPLLFEFAAAGVPGSLELYSSLRYAHVPTELIFYPGESHLFWNPLHQLSAMSSNIDWFNFWLNGHEDTDRSKHDEYARWEELCDLQRAQRPTRRTFCVPSKSH